MILILREEFICAVIIIFLMVYYLKNKVADKGQPFIKLMCFALMHVIFDIITVYTVNHREIVPEAVNHILHILYYYTGFMFIRGFYSYTIYLCSIHKHIRLMEHLGYIPIIIFTVLIFILPIEYVDGRGTVYSYGPMVFAGYISFMIYCMACIGILVYSRKKLEIRVKWALYPMIGMMIVVVIAQAFIPELLATSAGIAFVCIGIFVALDNPDKDYKEQALWDFLTGLKNRNCFNRDIKIYQAKYVGQSKRVGVVVADLNNLKTVNDTWGHVEGDRLISTAANVLRENLISADHVYRIGGDEFAAIYALPYDEKVKSEIEAVQRECVKIVDLPVPLCIAMGYASDNTGKSVKEIFEIADKEMYENKIQLKSKMSDRD